MITQKQSRKARRAERQARRELLQRQQASWQSELERLDAAAPALSRAVADAQAVARAADEALRQARMASAPLQTRDGLAIRLGQLRNELADIAAEAEDDDA